MELLKQKNLIHRIPLDNGLAFVMPRTLLKWQWNSEKSEEIDCWEGSWQPKTFDARPVSLQDAQAIAELGAGGDCQKVLNLLCSLGVVTQKLEGEATAYSLQSEVFLQKRADVVAVLTGNVTANYWFSQPRDLYLCGCTYFAVTGR